jgi:hypothetical protein
MIFIIIFVFRFALQNSIIVYWGECEVVRLFLNNRLFNQELLFEMGDYHGR